MSRNIYDLIGLAAGICFILALKGLSSPKSARRGNLIGAVGATIATVIVFFYANGGKPLNHLPLILGAIGFGVLVGVPAARKVQMTQTPQAMQAPRLTSPSASFLHQARWLMLSAILTPRLTRLNPTQRKSPLTKK